jgi:cardiolipin synthase
VAAVTVPNALTLLRMAIVPLFVIALLEGEPRRALILFCVAGVTDALDGFLARHFGQQSVLGMYLDPAADKLLLVTAFVMLAVPGLHPGLVIPLWVTVLVFARDLLIVVTSGILHVALKVPTFPPSALSKVNTAAQIVAVVMVMVSGFANGALGPATGAVYVAAALTVASGVDYALRMNRIAARAEKGRKRESGVE